MWYCEYFNDDSAEIKHKWLDGFKVVRFEASDKDHLIVIKELQQNNI